MEGYLEYQSLLKSFKTSDKILRFCAEAPVLQPGHFFALADEKLCPLERLIAVFQSPLFTPVSGAEDYLDTLDVLRQARQRLLSREDLTSLHLHQVLSHQHKFWLPKEIDLALTHPALNHNVLAFITVTVQTSLRGIASSYTFHRWKANQKHLRKHHPLGELATSLVGENYSSSPTQVEHLAAALELLADNKPARQVCTVLLLEPSSISNILDLVKAAVAAVDTVPNK